MTTKGFVFAVEMSEKAEIFGESTTGAFDLEGNSDIAEVGTFARGVLADDFPRTELAYPDDTYGSPIYRLDEEAAKPRVYRWARPAAGPVSAKVASFLARYPAFAASLRALLVDRNESLVLPIIGTQFRPCIAELSSQVSLR